MSAVNMAGMCLFSMYVDDLLQLLQFKPPQAALSQYFPPHLNLYPFIKVQVYDVFACFGCLGRAGG